MVVKNPPASAEDVREEGSVPGSGRFPAGGHDKPLHILAWRIPWMEKPGGLQSIGLQKEGSMSRDMKLIPEF